MDSLSRQKIILTRSDNGLAGKINPSCEHCHVLLDTSAGAFTVTLPDAQGTMQREFIFKNIDPTTAATIIPQNGQYIDNIQTKTVAALASLSLWPDQVRTWWVI